LNLLYIFDNYVLDPERRELRAGGNAVAIEPQVFDLLVHLIRHREHVVSRDELIESIWGGRIVSESALSTRINAVRGAIGDSGIEQRLIKTLPRKGVRFIGEVREERKPSEAAVTWPEHPTVEAIDLNQAAEGLAGHAPGTEINGAAALLSVTSAPRESRGFFVGRSRAAAVAAICVLVSAILTWSYLARSAQSERSRKQWAVDLDPHNAAALASLSFAIVTGVLNHWSDDGIADLHAADLALQDALLIEPDSMRARGAQCQILRAMRQFEAAIKACSELAQKFPDYAFPHKEIGYDRLMMGQPDEALTEFLEADRLAPDSQLRWSWQQGIGLVYLMQGEDQKAIEWLSRAAREAPNAGHPTAYLAAAYALVGREQQARDAMGHYLKLWPDTTLKTFGPTIGSAAFSSNMQRVLEGLRLAGLPD
jgi:DNA-binding winged helix-turn-helix (wHTH) protein